MESRRQMHVSFVLAGLGPGGAERVVSLISARWAACGHQVDVIAFDAPEAPVYHSFDPRVTLIRLNHPPAPRRRPAAALAALRRVMALRRTLRHRRPDLIISFLTKINALSLLAGVGLGIPTIVSERNNPRLQGADPAWNKILALLYGRAAAVVTQTRGSHECLPKRIRPHAVTIPNPILMPGRATPDSPEPTLTAVGRLVPQKGFDLLIRAFSQIATAHPAWSLVIWGEGPLRLDLEAQIAEANLEGRVHLPGLSPTPGSWVAQASAFVLSSRYEGFANVVGEAMAAGLPVAAFDCAYGPADMIRHEVDGLLVPDGDVEELARTLGRLLGDASLRARLAAAARQSATRLRPDLVLREWDALMLRVVPARVTGRHSSRANETVPANE